MHIINKIAFLVHEPIMFAHYSHVWSQMKTEEFIIVLCHECDLEGGGTAIGAEELLDKTRKLGYETEFFSNAIRRKHKYRYVVSNHRMEGSSFFPGNTKEKFIKEVTNIKKRFSNYIGVIRGRKKSHVNTWRPGAVPTFANRCQTNTFYVRCRYQ